MVYVALLRGVNVGGKSTVSMATLKNCFEQLGFTDVKTYINSGNVIFRTEDADQLALARRIETALDAIFDPGIRVLIKNREQLQAVADAVPAGWTHDKVQRTDVMFLWPEIDTAATIEQLPVKSEIETVSYLPGVVIWHIDRAHITSSRMPRIIGTPLYKQITIRNLNTVRKLHTLAYEID
jgi:uncharacterized protein (DUF1697 family)